MPALGHVAAQHLDAAFLDLACPGDQRHEAGLAHAVRPDQADHAAFGNVQVDARQGLDLAIALVHALQAHDPAAGMGRRALAHCAGWAGSLMAKLAGHSWLASVRSQAMPGTPVLTCSR